MYITQAMESSNVYLFDTSTNWCLKLLHYCTDNVIIPYLNIYPFDVVHLPEDIHHHAEKVACKHSNGIHQVFKYRNYIVIHVSVNCYMNIEYSILVSNITQCTIYYQVIWRWIIVVTKDVQVQLVLEHSEINNIKLHIVLGIGHLCLTAAFEQEQTSNISIWHKIY